MTNKEAPLEQSERLHMRISPDELAAIDDWRFAHRAPSRSEAVRRLIQIGARLQEELQPIYDITASQMDKFEKIEAALDEYLQNPRSKDESPDPGLSRFLVAFVDWEYQAKREAIELHDQMVGLIQQHNAFTDVASLDEALKAANVARVENERRRAFREERLRQWAVGDADGSEA